MRPDQILRRWLLLLAVLPLCQAGALAQSSTCLSLQNQLASLERSGGGRAAAYAGAAQRQVDEMQRTAAYARQIGCSNSRFLIFGSDPPPQCGELMARLSRMQANLAGLQQQADQLGGGQSALAHRYQLQAAIRQYCGDQRQAGPGQAGLGQAGLGQAGLGNQPFDQDREPLETPLPGDMTADDQNQNMGSGKPVCVRLCDGYFFPLASLGKGGRDAVPAMCQAQCPGAETEAFSLGANDDITQAVGPGGKSYMELDNALRYQRATVTGCSCRRANESWGQALKGAEDMLGTTGSDMPVSADKAAELSRPATPQPAKKGAASVGTAQPATVAPPAPAPPAKSAAPAAASPPNGLRQAVGPDGSRNVRIIAPAPSPAAQP
ncbi:Protein of unknown function [Rhizobiales bacterium GAS191]|nr:Protein of unknown function [Rhizobiales bacterium GAS191]